MANLLKATTFINEPVGSVKMHGNATAPSGWLNCDGSAVSRTTYANLFSIIGTTCGVGDNSTTFNVPDVRSAFPRGAGTSTGFTQNHTTTLGTKENDQIQGHIHNTTLTSINFWSGTYVTQLGSSGSNVYRNDNPNTAGALTEAANGTVRAGNETRPNNLGINFIIKF